MKNVKDLFDLSIDKDYYKLIITKGALNNKHIQYESKAGKGKNLSIKRYLNMVRPYLSDIINDPKTQGKWRIHSGNKIVEHKVQNEWKIQLIMTINSISSKDSDETRTMHTKSNNAEIMIGCETDEIMEELFKSFFVKTSRRTRGINDRN